MSTVPLATRTSRLFHRTNRDTMSANSAASSSRNRCVYLRDIWPTTAEIKRVVDDCVEAKMFTDGYADVFAGDEKWRGMQTSSSEVFTWEPSLDLRTPTAFRRYAM